MPQRWKNKDWLAFVRSLPCRCKDPRCPNCNGSGLIDKVVAAHLRSNTGIGRKPHDFLTYPLSDFIHRTFHYHGHPSVAWQLERVAEVWHVAFERGVLLFRPDFTDMEW